MKTAGIIAEYNPFHNGHAYQFREIKKRTEADYIVIAMSGDYVQRGEPAVIDKYTRTQMALENGADLVLELPVGIATASAEAFAYGGVELLAGTGVINYLGFGAETDDLSALMELAHILNEEPEAYQTALRQALSDGQSFPAARADAVEKYVSDCIASKTHSININSENIISKSANASDINFKNTISAILLQPNNILAIEYLKALEQMNNHTPSQAHCGTQITPILISRIGDDYHARDAQSQYASATAIRKLLSASPSATSDAPFEESLRHQNITKELFDLIPSSCMNTLNSYATTARFLNADNLSEILGYRLLLLRSEGYEQFADVSPELSSRIRKSVDHYQNFTQFAELLKTKELTYTRISRALLHIVLNIKKETHPTPSTDTQCPFAESASNQKRVNTCISSANAIPYLRILGFRRDAAPLLHEIKNHASLPVLAKLADAPSILGKEAMSALQQEIFVSDLYQQLARRSDSAYINYSSSSITNEINHGLVII